MKNPNKRYDAVSSNFCGVQFQSVRVDDIDYYPIALLPKDKNGINGFQNSQEKASRELKRMMGKGFRTPKIAVSGIDNKAVCVDHSQLIDIIDEMAFTKGCKFCRVLLKASVDVQLKMANDRARGKEQEVQYYIELAAIRAKGIRYRRLFTDVVKMQKELGFELNYGYLTLLVYQFTDLIDKYNAWKEVFPTRNVRAKNPFRGTLNELELNRLSHFELNAAERSLAKKTSIIQALKDTGDFFSI